MGAADRPVLKLPQLSRSSVGFTQRLRQRLRLGLRRSGSAAGGGRGEPEQDPLLTAGQRLRQAREERSLGLRQLAQETRISTAVLEALERGWRDRLPEPTYLRTMLPLLEQHLDLSPGSLHGALPRRVPAQAGAAGRESLRRRFTPGSIDVFTSWQGTLLYALIVLGLIHLLNLQQFRLASQGLHSSRPLPPLARTQASAAISDAAVIAAYPDLRPIAQAARGQALQQLRQEGRGRRPAVDLSLSELRLSLAEPTSVQLRGARGGATRLDPVAGELTLPVLPPFRLELDPPPPAGAVRWRQQPLASLPSEPGVYTYPPAPASAAASRSPAPEPPTPRP